MGKTDAQIESPRETMDPEDMEKPLMSGLAAHEERPLTAEERKAENRVILKIDILILPLLSIMYFLASLDRGDIGNAAVAGMTKELHMTPAKLSNCVSLFYLGYILFQLPGDVFLRKLTPPVQLSGALIAWGTFTALLSVAKSYGTVAGLRILIGVGEAFLQAAPLYLTVWYKRDELASRGAIFFSMMAVAGSFNGIIAYGITRNLNGARGMHAWQWIFLIEGIISIAYGILIFFILPTMPEKVKWGFSALEKDIAIRRSREAFNVIGTGINWGHLLALIKDPKAYFYTALYCCTNLSLAAFGSFLPVIVSSFGYSTLDTQLMTIPVYICAAVVLLVIGFASDRTKQRGIPMLISCVLAGAGWLILLVSTSHHLSYAATFLVGMGTLPQAILNQAWGSSNIIGYTKRAGMLALSNIFGQCFSIIGAEVYSDAPRYRRGNSFGLAAMIVAAFLTVWLEAYLRRQNQIKREQKDSDEARNMRTKSLEEVCDAHPDFYYFL